MKPSCYNRPEFVKVVKSTEFDTSYPFRMSEDCPQWKPGGNAYSMAFCDSVGGIKTEWKECEGCKWKTT